jgi:thymidine phosphorylase
MMLGAGRAKLGDRIDPAVGVILHKKKGDYVNEGEVLAVLHVNSHNLTAAASNYLPAVTA